LEFGSGSHIFFGLDEELLSVTADDGEKRVSVRLLESCLKAKLVAVKRGKSPSSLVVS
jgi:hypothetical protein